MELYDQIYSEGDKLNQMTIIYKIDKKFLIIIYNKNVNLHSKLK